MGRYSETKTSMQCCCRYDQYGNQRILPNLTLQIRNLYVTYYKGKEGSDPTVLEKIKKDSAYLRFVGITCELQQVLEASTSA